MPESKYTALVRLQLPAPLLIRPDQNLKAFDVTVRLGDAELQAEIGPPYRSLAGGRPIGVGHPPLTLVEDLKNLDPDPSAAIEPHVKIDGAPAVLADAIAVVLYGIPPFDRRVDAGADQKMQALIAVAARVVDDTLNQLRVVARLQIRRFNDQHGPLALLTLLDEEGNEHPRESGKLRGGAHAYFPFRRLAVTAGRWEATIAGVNGYEHAPWVDLLLATQSADAELGVILVLARAAIETRIAAALDVLAASNVDTDLWEWLSMRRGDYRLTPSVSDQLDTLLRVLGGRGLKDDNDLWEHWVNLSDARNSFVHEGRAYIGKKTAASRTTVTLQRARELAVAAERIVDFIEAQLPADRQWPLLKPFPMVTTSFPVARGSDLDS